MLCGRASAHTSRTHTEVHATSTLQDGFDFGIDGDVGGGEAVDGVTLGGRLFGEVEKTADVIVLVEAGEEAFGVFDRKTKL